MAGSLAGSLSCPPRGRPSVRADALITPKTADFRQNIIVASHGYDKECYCENNWRWGARSLLWP
ncbi:hypothetical protein FRACA_10147 [Frankia canadensis]|uniref:Uncharacterized protein n=1 Tax=Frankia canadensis TaxID=1836972 RepID=A0A2I2KI93_9ACTN|nr:hypothetical protein FRACA_10147 [Frankia canadensis]SOU52678.1 hypothetical protein FRACA_10147 [Frankia canadensis]